MKRLIVCSDGTWQRPDQQWSGKRTPTNVVKLKERVAKQDGDVQQIAWYRPGVGTGNLVDMLLGGAFGVGLDENILQAYGFLVQNYVPGDQLFLFGFSRGAYTVRSLAGMIRKCGILRDGALARKAMELYRDSQHPDDPGPQQFRAANSVDGDAPTPIQMIGVWDTVGALGIPFGRLSALTHKKYEFHDTRLSGSVRYAFHALAVDERRKPFKPTLWSSPAKPGQTLEQVWFSGRHSDIGGGFGSAELPDIALEWMTMKARTAGLALLPSPSTHPDPLSPFNWIEGAALWEIVNADRAVGVDEQGKLDPSQTLNRTVLERWDVDGMYRPAGLRAYFKRIGDARGNAPYSLGLLDKLRTGLGF
jgi:uncharacterized protein (DUF2235 family)